jgi:hypothetical protein
METSQDGLNDKRKIARAAALSMGQGMLHAARLLGAVELYCQRKWL